MKIISIYINTKINVFNFSFQRFLFFFPKDLFFLILYPKIFFIHQHVNDVGSPNTFSKAIFTRGTLLSCTPLPVPSLDEKKCQLGFMLIMLSSHYTTCSQITKPVICMVFHLCQKYVDMLTVHESKHLSMSIQLGNVLQLRQIYFDNETVC